MLLGAVLGAAVCLLGLPNPALWGAMAFVLNFIPFAGALLAVPMLKTLKIFCDNIPQLARVGQFVGR